MMTSTGLSNKEESGNVRPWKMERLSRAHTGSGAGVAKTNRELPVWWYSLIQKQSWCPKKKYYKTKAVWIKKSTLPLHTHTHTHKIKQEPRQLRRSQLEGPRSSHKGSNPCHRGVSTWGKSLQWSLIMQPLQKWGPGLVGPALQSVRYKSLPQERDAEPKSNRCPHFTGEDTKSQFWCGWCGSGLCVGFKKEKQSQVSLHGWGNPSLSRPLRGWSSSGLQP